MGLKVKESQQQNENQNITKFILVPTALSLLLAGWTLAEENKGLWDLEHRIFDFFWIGCLEQKIP